MYIIHNIFSYIKDKIIIFYIILYNCIERLFNQAGLPATGLYLAKVWVSLYTFYQ